MEYKYQVLVICIWLLVQLSKCKSYSDPQDAIPKFGTRLKKLSSNEHQRRSLIVPKNVPTRESDIKTVEVSKESDGVKNKFSLFGKTDKSQQSVHHPHRTLANRTSNHKSSSPDVNVTVTELENRRRQNLLRLPNLQLNRIEPFWPFSNVTSTYLINNLKVIDGGNQHFGFPQNNLPERFKDTTFFFSHVGPNSFEYRAQFHHNQESLHQPKQFNPFVNEFPEFPKFPTLNVPDPPQLFQQKPQYPTIPDLKQFPFSSLFPQTKPVSSLIQEDPVGVKFPETNTNNGLEEPLNVHHKRNVILNDITIQYPKIFKFNDERINIEEFERQKKLQMKLNALNSNRVSEPENVQRNQLLILHGGIFTVKEPPLYHRKVIRKRRQRLRNNQIVNY